MAPILRSVNLAQVARGGRWVVSGRNFSSYRRSYESKGPGMQFHLIRVTGVTMGYYFGCTIHGHWVSELEVKRQEAVRKATGNSGEIQDLTEKMWSDVKVVMILSDLTKKMISAGEKTLSDLREKMGSDRRS